MIYTGKVLGVKYADVVSKIEARNNHDVINVKQPSGTFRNKDNDSCATSKSLSEREAYITITTTIAPELPDPTLESLLENYKQQYKIKHEQISECETRRKERFELCREQFDRLTNESLIAKEAFIAGIVEEGGIYWNRSPLSKITTENAVNRLDCIKGNHRIVAFIAYLMLGPKFEVSFEDNFGLIGSYDWAFTEHCCLLKWDPKYQDNFKSKEEMHREIEFSFDWKAYISYICRDAKQRLSNKYPDYYGATKGPYNHNQEAVKAFFQHVLSAKDPMEWGCSADRILKLPENRRSNVEEVLINFSKANPRTKDKASNCEINEFLGLRTISLINTTSTTTTTTTLKGSEVSELLL